MAHYVKCRVCGERMDIDSLPSEEWTKPQERMYYHTKCYNDWRGTDDKNGIKKDRDEEFWWNIMIEYLYRDVKMSMDFAKIKSQWENFIRPKTKRQPLTPKGIFFTLRYYYAVQRGDKTKALGGIGIVPSLYKDAERYWSELERKRTNTMEAIVEQISNREARPVKIIVRKEQTTNKTRFDLDSI